jgi:hypothetical protein
MAENTGTVIRVNSQFLEVCRLRGYQDLDGFGLRFAVEASHLLASGESLKDALCGAFDQAKTTFFRVNKVSRTEVCQEIAARLKGLITEEPFQESVRRFKDFAERQLVQKLRSNQDEETFRSYIQTHLDGNFLSYREVESGAGRSDILIVHPYRELVEVKLWGGETYFNDGITELVQYVKTEGLERGHYVNIEFGQASNFLDAKGSDTWVEHRDGKEVIVTFVRIPRVSPSRLGRDQRRIQGGGK